MLQPMGSQRVGRDWAAELNMSDFAGGSVVSPPGNAGGAQETQLPVPRWGHPLEEAMVARTPVFWPGKSMDRGAGVATVHGVTKESEVT